MPTYEYVCTKCDHKFEIFQSMKDKTLEVCPKEACPHKKWGKGKLKKQVGAGAGFLFKGSGFYITDYRSEGYKSSAKKDVSAASPTPISSTTTASSSPSPSAPATSSTAAAKPKPSPVK
jgi:putative FmdB family regulatory protein